VTSGERDRALAALHGLAIGDALGMPTQLMSRAEIERRWGRIAGFEAGPADHPIAAGLAAGSITDDTEQALLLGDLLVESGGRIDAEVWATRLVSWEDGMRARGSLDLLGPSTKSAIAAVLAGTPAFQAGRFGTTNGAAMRIAPVGIAAGPDDLVALVDRVQEASRVSHDTGLAIAGASAVAAAISAGIAGATLGEAIALAIEAAEEGATRGHWVAGADIAARIDFVVADGAEYDLDDLVGLIGTSLASQESVPMAFAIASRSGGDVWVAALAAANAGGDTDTIGAIAGAICGAVGGADAVSASAIETVTAANPDLLAPVRLGALIDGLLALRFA
jgi:ADP-ribosylglycohydrolase